MMTNVIEPMATGRGTVKTLNRTLQEWSCYTMKPTGKVKTAYAEVVNCIDQMDAGESVINGMPAESALIWATAKFIDSLGKNLEKEHRQPPLDEVISLSIMLIRHMSNLTYWEILSLFPVPLLNDDGSYKEDASGYFDGSDIYFDENYGHFHSPSLNSINLIRLSFCGLHFNEEDGPTDFDAKIGDGVMEYIMNNTHPILHSFYKTFIYAVYCLDFCEKI